MNMAETNPTRPPLDLVADAVTTDVGDVDDGADDDVVGQIVSGEEELVAVAVTGTVVVVSTRLPVRVGTAYGGSKRPNRPQALHGYAHELTCFGAARTGSHRESTMVAIAEGSAV